MCPYRCWGRVRLGVEATQVIGSSMPDVGAAVSRVPASFFGIVLGIAALANAWRLAHVAWSLPAMIGERCS